MPPLKIKLRVKDRNKANATDVNQNHPPDDPPPGISKGAWAMRKMRAKIKANPELYAQKKEEERVRSLNRRKNATPEQKDSARETARQRMSRCRKKQQEIKTRAEERRIANNIPPVPLTRAQLSKKEELKKYNRDKKRESRQRQTAQKKRRERESNAIRNAVKRAEAAETKEKKSKYNEATKSKKRQANLISSSPAFKSVNAKCQAAFRANINMPSTPKRWAAVVDYMSVHSTPRRRAALDKLQGKAKVRKQLTDVYQCLRDIKSKIRKKHKASLPRKNFLSNLVSTLRNKYKAKAKEVSQGLGISWCETKQYCQGSATEQRRPRCDKTMSTVVQNVTNFLERPDNSVELPNKKSVSSGQPGRVAQRSMDKLYEKWKEENPDSTLGKTKFIHIRRQCTNVKTQQHRQTLQCLCEYCANVELKMRALQPLMSFQMGDKYDIAKKTLCEYDTKGYPALQCVDRTCPDCGTKSLEQQLHASTKEKNVTWLVWEYRETERTKNKRRVLVKKTTSTKELLKELMTDLTTFTSHLFHAQWQHHMYNYISHNVPQNAAVFVMDFAENFSCFYQEEIQSAHWAKNVVTLHPIVCYYRCPEHNVMVREYLNFLTKDNIHDSAAVATFVEMAIRYLRQKRGLVLDRVIQFTDGAASQYKSRSPFYDISCGQEDHRVVLERHFFGSRHGKGPCDGEGGVVKAAATRAVKNGQVIINDAKSFYDYCEDNLTRDLHSTGSRICEERKTFGRTFFLVEDIQHQRPSREGTTVKGTRQLHSVIGGRQGLESGKIAVRRLSCFCKGCEESGPCENQAHVMPHKMVNLTKTHDSSSHRGQPRSNVRKTARPPAQPLGPQAQPLGPQAQPLGPQAQPQGPPAQPSNSQADQNRSLPNEPFSSPPCPTGIPEPHTDVPDEQTAVDLPNSNNGDQDALHNGPAVVVQQPARGTVDPCNEKSVAADQLPSPMLPTKDPEQSHLWKEGDWVLVCYGGQQYPGTVTAIVGGNVEVDCLEKSGKFWKWPQMTDKIWYDVGNVTKILSPPEPVTNRGQLCFKNF